MVVDICHDDIEKATEVLKGIAADYDIGVIFGQNAPRSMRVGDAPTMYACLMEHKGVKIAVTRSPAATPNVIEPLMHEMAHAVIGHEDSMDQDREVCALVLKWAECLPPALEELVRKETHVILAEYDNIQGYYENTIDMRFAP